MLEIVRHVITKHPELNDSISEMLRRQAAPKSDSLDQIFGYIFDGNKWGGRESVSGPGSELRYTENLRAKLPILFNKYKITSVLDAPCGDFNWMRLVVGVVPINYLGVDIVESLVLQNSRKYESERVKFKLLDIVADDLPDADIIICRDCLFHLSFENIGKFVDKFLQSNIKYILTTTHKSAIVSKNIDIQNGDFRLIDLYAAPFNFPRDSLEVIEDWIPGYHERQMVMWSREQLISHWAVS